MSIYKLCRNRQFARLSYFRGYSRHQDNPNPGYSFWVIAIQ